MKLTGLPLQGVKVTCTVICVVMSRESKGKEMSNYSEDIELEALYGPAAKFSEHKRGDTIRFREDGKEFQGDIIWVKAAGPAIEGGKHHPVIYVVDTGGDSFPSMVYPGEVIQ